MTDPTTEIRITALHATRGANYWSTRPVTRMDLVVGAYDDISSADAAEVTDQLIKTMPGLYEHRCSIGERGGFITRLRRGTYAPHIVEHVALELQGMIGHDVGFGRTRGGDVPGEYTLVFEHKHEAVGLRSAALALEIVQCAFSGTLQSVDHAVAELNALAQTAKVPPLAQKVLCGITGSDHRSETRDEILRRLEAKSGEHIIVDVSPSYLLQAGLPYSHSELAIILDANPTDVPDRYKDPERARKLVSVLADAVCTNSNSSNGDSGLVICPAKEWELQDRARDAGCKVAIFATDDDVTRRDKKVASSVASVEKGRILVEHLDECIDAGELLSNVPAAAQVAAALAAFTIKNTLKENNDIGDN